VTVVRHPDCQWYLTGVWLVFDGCLMQALTTDMCWCALTCQSCILTCIDMYILTYINMYWCVLMCIDMSITYINILMSCMWQEDITSNICKGPLCNIVYIIWWAHPTISCI
jgi:hypothetical protein